MRRNLLAGFGVVCAAALAVVPAADAKRNCSVTRSKTLLATTKLRVYRTRAVKRDGTAKSTVVACWLASGRRTQMVSEYNDPSLGATRLIGVRLGPNSTEVIGYEDSEVGGTFYAQNLTSLNVRLGRPIARGTDASAGVLEWVLTTNGALAWIGGPAEMTGPSDCSGVHAVDHTGNERFLECVVAPAAMGSPPSTMTHVLNHLAWSGGTLSWLSDGQPKSAALD